MRQVMETLLGLKEDPQATAHEWTRLLFFIPCKVMKEYIRFAMENYFKLQFKDNILICEYVIFLHAG